MAYFCRTCKAEFDSPADLPKTGFVGRYARKCPSGHVLMRMPSVGRALIYGMFMSFLAYVTWVSMWLGILAPSFEFGDSAIGTSIFVVLWLRSSIGMVVSSGFSWHSSRKMDSPLNKTARPKLVQTVSGLIAFIICLGLGWSRYVEPVSNSDLTLKGGGFVGRLFSAREKVRSVHVMKDDHVALIDLHNNMTVQTTRLDRLPSEGQFIHTFGRAYLNTGGGLTFVEQFRLDGVRRSEEHTSELQ